MHDALTCFQLPLPLPLPPLQLQHKNKRRKADAVNCDADTDTEPSELQRDVEHGIPRKRQAGICRAGGERSHLTHSWSLILSTFLIKYLCNLIALTHKYLHVEHAHRLLLPPSFFLLPLWDDSTLAPAPALALALATLLGESSG